MRVRCPHCHSPLEIVADEAVAEVVCPSCGSSLAGVNETLISITPETRLLGHFQLVECVGRGYFGEVWKARDTDLRRTVAIKIPRTQDLTEEIRERFHREAKTTAQLRHPNIVPVHEVGRDAETIFIVSDFIDGMTLAERIALDRPAPREAAELCNTLALALHYAHEAGVIHRDIKPSNIMLDREKKPYLMDFGLAKQEAGEFTMTASGDILGTPAYMPPEQARGDSHLADRRSDVYSLGVILYELLTGERPFKGSTHLLIKAILNVEPSPPSKINRQLPRDLETICLKAMSKEPHHRYATALEFAEDLQRYLRGESIIARRASSVERGWRWMRRNPAVATMSGVALIAVLGMIGVLWARPTVPPPFRQRIRLTTQPVSASVTLFPINPDTGEPALEKGVHPPTATPIELQIEPGDYLIVATTDDEHHTFHEVLRHVPFPGEESLVNEYPHLTWKMVDGICELPKINLPLANVTDRMAKFDGTEKYSILSGWAGTSERTVPIADFFLDETEVLVKDVYTRWPNSRSNPPFMLSQMRQQPPPENFPVGAASWHEAVAFAEAIGKRLPTEAEHEFATTAGGQQRFPWGNDVERITEWEFDAGGVPAWDRLTTHPSVVGLYSNVAEWTSSWLLGDLPVGVKRSEMRIVGGGNVSIIAAAPTQEDWSRGPRMRASAPTNSWNKGLGFRCARSSRPRSTSH